jgi:hypothetical protein
VRVQRDLAQIYRTTAERLARVLGRKPFSPGRANTIMMAVHERGDARYGDVFTIPQ